MSKYVLTNLTLPMLPIIYKKLDHGFSLNKPPQRFLDYYNYPFAGYDVYDVMIYVCILSRNIFGAPCIGDALWHDRDIASVRPSARPWKLHLAK